MTCRTRAMVGAHMAGAGHLTCRFGGAAGRTRGSVTPVVPAATALMAVERSHNRDRGILSGRLTVVAEPSRLRRGYDHDSYRRLDSYAPGDRPSLDRAHSSQNRGCLWALPESAPDLLSSPHSKREHKVE
jgi:hypothetical protein